LAIGGPEAWTALAIREDTTVAKKNTEVAAPKTKQKGGKHDRNALKALKRRKGKKPKFSSGPKV
jgi:hypothetical protein